LLPSGEAALKFKQEQIERYMAQERESLMVMRVEQLQAVQVRSDFLFFAEFFFGFAALCRHSTQPSFLSDDFIFFPLLSTMILFVLFINAIVQILKDVSNLSAEELRHRISRSTSIRSALTPAQQLIAARAAAAAGDKKKGPISSRRSPLAADQQNQPPLVRHISDRTSLSTDNSVCRGCLLMVPAKLLIAYGSGAEQQMLCRACVERKDEHASSALVALEQARAMNTRLMCEDCGTRPALTRREVCQTCLDVRRAIDDGESPASSASPSLNASLTTSNGQQLPPRNVLSRVQYDTLPSRPAATAATAAAAESNGDGEDAPPPPPEDDGEEIVTTNYASVDLAEMAHRAEYGPMPGKKVMLHLGTVETLDADTIGSDTDVDATEEFDGRDVPLPRGSTNYALAVPPLPTATSDATIDLKPTPKRALPTLPARTQTPPSIVVPAAPAVVSAPVSQSLPVPTIAVSQSSSPPSSPLKAVSAPVGSTASPGVGDNDTSTIRRRIASTAAKNWMVSYDEIEFHKKIGAGSFGEVWTAELWGMECAVKKIPDSLISDEAVGDFLSELEILASLRHPNVVLMLAAVVEASGRMAIVSELCARGSVNSVLTNKTLQPELTLGRRSHFALDCAYAMLYLHKLNIVHCVREDDHQLLTDRGFMFLDDVLATVQYDAAIGCVTDWRGLKVASFDERQQCIVYETPRALVINQPRPGDTVIELAELGADAGGDCVSFAVTAGHHMYASIDGKPFAKLRADELAMHAARGSNVQFMRRAVGGVAASASAMCCDSSKATYDGPLDLPAFVALGLTTAGAVTAFLELYGYLLCGGGKVDAQFVVDRLGLLGWQDCSRLYSYDFLLEQMMLAPAGCRSIIAGLFVASGRVEKAQQFRLSMSSVRLRDQVVQLCLHAGYSAFAQDYDVWFSNGDACARQVSVTEVPLRSRTWCFSMPNGFIVARAAQRVKSMESGTTQWTVTTAAPATIQGNCDLKARNLLIDKDWNAKLCDFGLSMVRTDSRVRLAGTRGYMAPELMCFFADIYDGRAEMIFTFKSDVYSYGIMLNEIYASTDAELVDWANTNEELEAIARGDRPRIPPNMHANYRELMVRCWDQDPEVRPLFKDVIASLKPIVSEFDALGKAYPQLGD
jgi:hypothetical protein